MNKQVKQLNVLLAEVGIIKRKSKETLMSCEVMLERIKNLKEEIL